MLYIHQWTKCWDGTVTLGRCTISSMCLLTYPCHDHFDKCRPLFMVAFLDHQMLHGVSLELEFCISCGFSGLVENRFWNSNILFLWSSTVFWYKKYCHQPNAHIWNIMNFCLSLSTSLRLYSRRNLNEDLSYCRPSYAALVTWVSNKTVAGMPQLVHKILSQRNRPVINKETD
jgi:hypothetical protein